MPQIAPEFYVGYSPKAPPSLATFLGRVVVAVGLASLTLAVVVAFAQASFIPRRFEFQQYRSYRGTLFERPYPVLESSGLTYLLVARGKHGAGELVSGLDGRSVRLDGALIQSGPDHALEILPGSVKPGDAMSAPRPNVRLGPLTITGEIVDTKCYLGVMNPGRGKVHKDCAIRCISGGIPPGLLVRDSAGKSGIIYLSGRDSQSIGRRILRLVGEPIILHGELFKVGSQLVLQVAPEEFPRE